MSAVRSLSGATPTPADGVENGVPDANRTLAAVSESRVQAVERLEYLVTDFC
jgi:hypothetical protein